MTPVFQYYNIEKAFGQEKTEDLFHTGPIRKKPRSTTRCVSAVPPAKQPYTLPLHEQQLLQQLHKLQKTPLFLLVVMPENETYYDSSKVTYWVLLLFFAFPKSIQRSIYTTNLIENFNKNLERGTKANVKPI